MRLFVAVELPDTLKERLAALAGELPVDAITAVKAENMHLTLRFIGEVPDAITGKITEKLKEVEFEKFSVRLKGVGVFPNESYVRVVWAGCEGRGLGLLAGKVRKALRGIGKEEERGFSPHLTIARVKRKIDIQQFLERYKNKEFGEFEVGKLKLVQSVLGKGGPVYSVVAAFSANE